MPFGKGTPPLTEANLPDQSGKVFIVTGATSGYGLILTTILYQHNAKVYLAARNTSKTEKVIADIQKDHPSSQGSLHPLHLDLSDLTTIKKSADDFLSKESQLHVLWNNAGVMIPPQGSKTKQGYELQLGTNNIGPHFFTKLLYPTIAQTAKTAPAGTVRVVWVSSDAISRAPKGVIDFNNMDYHKDEGAWQKYGRSKAGTILQSVELARRSKDDGVVSISLDPGIAMTEIQRTMNPVMMAVVKLIAQKPAVGAYTQLFAGLSPDVKIGEGLTSWVNPPGKKCHVRRDLLDADLAKKYWDWNEEQIKPYL